MATNNFGIVGRVCFSLMITICILSLVPPQSQAFRVGGRGTIFMGDTVNPEQASPFIHWDLREFPGCTIPYSLNIEGPNDDVQRDGDIDIFDFFAALAAIDASFASWQNVVPSPISFVNSPATTQARRVAMDGQNTIFWLTGASDDVQSIPFSQGEPNEVCIDPGANGALNSVSGGDDIIAGNQINTGANGIAESTISGDDAEVIPRWQGLANSVCVQPGPNGTIETTIQGDDALEGNTITTGANGVAESAVGDESPGFVALTGLFYSNQTGKLIEGDIWFNDGPNFRWNIGLEHPPDYDIQETATHEAGHLLGLMHSEIADATMSNNWPNDLSKQSLEADDIDGCNFLYTPDLGDAPDPFPDLDPVFNNYPSLVHGSTPSRILNDIQLFEPGEGAEHLFGIRPGEYRYEWIGPDADDSPEECEAKVTDMDLFDDGIEFLCNRAQQVVGVRYSVHVFNPFADRYNHAANGHSIYINAWYDSSWNHDWEHPGEHVIHRTLTPGFDEWRLFLTSYTVTERVNFPPYSWFRIRLDWGEDAGAFANIDGTLEGPRGAAQFGEVQDHFPFCGGVIYNGWHHPYDYPEPQQWPWWDYPGLFEAPLNLWIDVPWWFNYQPFPPPAQSFWFGIAVPSSFIDDGWTLAGAQFREYAPNGGGDIIANLIPDDTLSMDLNALYPMGDNTTWFGFKIDDYTLPEQTMVLYFHLSRAEVCVNPLLDNFHFASGDEINGWNPEFYEGQPIAICGAAVPCAYVPGDINGNGTPNGIDVSYGVSYLKGGPPPPVQCDMCPEPAPFYAAGDVNGNCAFNGIDITYFVRYLKGGAALQYCPDCPPAGLNPPAPAVLPIKAPVLKAKESFKLQQ